MPLSPHRSPGLAAVLIALAVAPVAIATARDSSSPPAGSVRVHDDGPRNAAAEAATGDATAMLAVVQDAVRCLRAKGFEPGDPHVRGENVVITDWDPSWDSAAGRATEECSFPAR
jgi:hypothetical protein